MEMAMEREYLIVVVVMSVFRASLDAERAFGLFVQMSIPSATFVVQEVWIGNSSLGITQSQSKIPSNLHNTHSALAYVSKPSKIAYPEASGGDGGKRTER